MSSLEARLNALETETQLKINRQFLKRIEALENDNRQLNKRICELENQLNF